MTDKPLTIIALDHVTMRAEVSTNDAVHRWLQSVVEIMDRQVADQIELIRASRDELLSFGIAAIRIPGAPAWAIRARIRHHVPTKPKLYGREIGTLWFDGEPSFASVNRYPAHPLNWWTPRGHS